MRNRSAKPTTAWATPSIIVLQLSADAAADVESRFGAGGLNLIRWKQQGVWKEFGLWTDAQTGKKYAAERLHLSPIAAKNGAIDPLYQRTPKGCQYRLRAVAQDQTG